jgi:hypothetical protein
MLELSRDLIQPVISVNKWDLGRIIMGAIASSLHIPYTIAMAHVKTRIYLMECLIAACRGYLVRCAKPGPFRWCSGRPGFALAKIPTLNLGVVAIGR